MEESKGYIEINPNREISEHPADAGLAELIQRYEVSDASLAAILKDTDKRPERKKIITEALISNGRDWRSLWGLREDENKAAAAKFGHLITFWDSLVDGQPKTPEQHRQEAEEFAKSLAE